MRRIITLLSVLILLGLVAACGGQAAPTPTPVPPPTPTEAPTVAAPAAPQPTAPGEAAASAPAGEVQQVEITLTPTDMRPGEITVKAGSLVHFVITNIDDTEEHNLVSAAAKIKEILVYPNQTVEVDWTVPDETGTYEVPCSIHREIIPLTIHVVQ